MSQHSGDRGVSIGGNARVSGQIATGDSVTQNQQINAAPGGAADAATVAAALERLARLLEQHAQELDEPQRARRDLADVREEIEEDDPDSERMEGALQRLGRRVGGVAVLAEAVHQLGAALGL
jgi:acyl transferase domain-containing protein